MQHCGLGKVSQPKVSLFDVVLSVPMNKNPRYSSYNFQIILCHMPIIMEGKIILRDASPCSAIRGADISG